MTPRTAALAFRIWQYANPRGWDCSSAEVGEALGVPTATVAKVANLKGWSRRLRVSRTDVMAAPNVMTTSHGFMVGANFVETMANYTRLAEEAPE